MNNARQIIRMKKQRGMTLIEIMVALTILAVGLLGMAGVFAAAMRGNNKTNKDTSATMLAQMVMEQINAQAANAVAPFPLTDCAFPAPNTFLINTLAGGAVLDANGNIDWTQGAPIISNAATAGYDMTFVSCGTGGQQIQYEVRWNIQTISNNSRLVTVSARQTANTTGGLVYAVPATLRSIGGV